MWNRNVRPLLLASTVLPVLSATAADGDFPVAHVSTNLNRLSLNARFGFNISARFQSAGTGPRAAIGNPVGGIDHFYDDGFVRVDGAGNAGGVTWFWGYQNNSQVVGDSLQFHTLAATSGGTTDDVDGDPQYGAELVYQRRLGMLGSKLHWGVEAGIGWSAIRLADSSPFRGGLDRITDTYAYEPGTIPPTAPFAGDFTYENFVIYDTPTRSSAPASGLALGGAREFEADLFALRLGPTLEIPVGRRGLLGLSGGLAVGALQADYTWQQSFPDGGGASGSGSDTDILLGGFLGVTFTWVFDPHWSASVGAQLQTLGTYSQSFEGAGVELDLSRMTWFSAGVGYSF